MWNDNECEIDITGEKIHNVEKMFMCQWLDSYASVAGRITHNVNKWNKYYLFIRMD